MLHHNIGLCLGKIPRASNVSLKYNTEPLSIVATTASHTQGHPCQYHPLFTFFSFDEFFSLVKLKTMMHHNTNAPPLYTILHWQRYCNERPSLWFPSQSSLFRFCGVRFVVVVLSCLLVCVLHAYWHGPSCFSLYSEYTNTSWHFLSDRNF